MIHDGLHRVQTSGASPKIVESAPTPWANRSGRSAAGTLWAARGEEVSVRTDEEWSRYLLPGRVLSIEAHPDADVVWIQTDLGWLCWQGETVRPVEGLDEVEVLDLDPSGRLLVSVDGRLERWGAGYSAVVTGLTPDQRLDVETTAVVIPSFVEDVVGIEAWVNGSLVLGEVVLVPTDLGDGAHEFRAEVTYVDETVVEVFVPFSVGEFGIPSWEGDIRPIFQANCALCHDGDTESVLNTVDHWRGAIDEIVTMMSSGEMPLGRDPVSASDMALVRAWRVSGMAP